MSLKCLVPVVPAVFAVLPLAATADGMRFVTGALPPFTQVQDGRAAGPMPEIVKAVCGRLGTHCTITVLPWRRVQHELESGQADGAFPVAELLDGSHTLHLGQPIIATGYSVFATSSSQLAYHVPMDLRNCTIGVPGPILTSQTVAKLTRNVPGVHVVMEVNDVTALKKLAHGHYQAPAAVIMNRDLAAALLKQEGIANVRAVGDVQAVEYRIGLSSSLLTREQTDAFDQALQGLIADGSVQAVLARYGLKAVSPQP